MKILFISRFVDPKPLSSNDNVFRQALFINQNYDDIKVEILTWPSNDQWSGPIPKKKLQFPPMTIKRLNINYHIFSAPLDWDEDTSVIDDKSYQKATEYGKKLINYINPDIVHLQHRHGIWWLLDSAQQLNIPTIYTNHDWGMACLRTILVKSNNKICNGKISIRKCSVCIRKHKSFIGNLNEIIVENIIGRFLISITLKIPFLGSRLRKRGIKKNNVYNRVQQNLIRVNKIFSNLSWLFTPSHFGVSFFEQFGIDKNKITFLPWYSNLEKRIKVEKKNFVNFTYVGRVSQEKGVKELLLAFSKIRDDNIIINIFGAIDSFYARNLNKKFKNKVGKHKIIWHGWREKEYIYSNADIIVIPSQWMDNTPLTLIETLFLNIPVVITDVSSMSEFIQEGRNGYKAKYNDINSLVIALKKSYAHVTHPSIKNFNNKIDLSIKNYCDQKIDIYRKILK